ncbi:MFS transporter [Mycolicibacterium sp.]|uniref:MFS transporter n=1 Tax=Mycolicibacterium sp. TaxID=2320850 RepID=UPI003D0E5B2C
MSAEHSVAAMPRVVMAGMAGTALEYYDFFLYGTAAALVFGPLFFPSYSPLAGTLASFATFAVGFLSRPLGSVIFGGMGDRIGRRRTLVFSLALMGLATVLIGALPTFDQIGWAAPALLVTLRFLQGIAMGGEWGGAALLLVEHSPARHRGLFGSTVQMGVPGGLILSTAAVSLSDHLSGPDFETWGWRLPFLFSIVLFALSLFVRLGVDETPDFVAMREAAAQRRQPVRKLLREHWSDVALAAAVIAPGGILFYLVSAYTISYGTSILGMSRTGMLSALLLASCIYSVTIPIAGHLSDRFSRRAVLLVGCASAALGGFAMFALQDTRTWWGAVIGIAVMLGLAHAALQAPQPAFLAERFPVDVRLSGVALSQALSVSVIGGTTPFVATLLFDWTSATWPICSWLAVWSVAGAAATVYLCRRPSQLHADDGRVAGARPSGTAPVSGPHPYSAS